MIAIFESNNFIVFIVSIIISNIAMSPVRSFGLKYGLIDKYERRKDYKGVIVRIGGVSIIIGSFLSFFLCYFLFNFNIDNQIIGLFIFSLIFFCIGFVDDIFSIKPKPRLAFQVFVTLIAFNSLENITFPIFRNLNFGNYFNDLFLIS